MQLDEYRSASAAAIARIVTYRSNITRTTKPSIKKNLGWPHV